jgi:UDP-glucose 6-dehydrogenase
MAQGSEIGAHTPGPWHFNADNFDGVIRVTVPTGPNTARYQTLARDVFGVANARLIAASPEVLRELIKARDTLNAVYVGMGMDEAGRAANLARFDAAIAKASHPLQQGAA